MIPDEVGHPINDTLGVAESLENDPCHPRPLMLMIKEVALSIDLCQAARLGNIVQQGRQAQAQIGLGILQGYQIVFPHCVLVVLILVTSNALDEFRDDVIQEPRLAHEFRRVRRAGGHQGLGELISYPFPGYLLDQRGELLNGLKGPGVNGKPELCREPDDSQHPQGVFFKSLKGIANSAKQFFLDVR